MAGGSDKEFDEEMRTYFGCSEGAYSEVTPTEAGDGQITLTGDEKRIVLQYFGEAELAKYRGNEDELVAKGLDARRPFKIYPAGEIVRPKVKYPKAEGSELRLYFSEESFKVEAGHYWGVFRRDGDLWLCHFGGSALDAIHSGELADKSRLEILEDEEDEDAYQEAVNDPEQVERSTKAWKRDPKLGLQAIKRAGYCCELFPCHETFESKATGKPFMEAHHVVPLGLQVNFTGSTQNLDMLDNIACVNPWTHRLIHHGRFDEFKDELAQLIAKRQSLLERLGYTEEDVLAIYDR